MNPLQELIDSGVDRLTVVANRDDVERGDVSAVFTTLQHLLDPIISQEFRGHVELGFDGYDNDPRELHEIPDVRSWMAQLDAVFPYWFYFISTAPDSTLSTIVLSLTELERGPMGYQPNASSLYSFLEKHFDAMNQICEQVGYETEMLIEHLTQRVMQRLTPS